MQAQPTTRSAACRSAPCAAVPEPRGKGSTTPAYWIARNYASLHVYLTVATLAKDMDIGLGSAQRLIDELQADGVLGEPDMFGVYGLRRAE